MRFTIPASQSPYTTLIEIDGGAASGKMVVELYGDRLHVYKLNGHGLIKHVGELFEFLTSVAAVAGCNSLSIRGRPGWQRVLKQYGFKPTHDGFLEVLL